ncbi:TPA: hydroxyacid dehydrogenase [Candidatus Bathyarchaeota archaeon]|nr:hydroxyacid dehydrogenase [Candidatus Bathyarchaeota archaeon]
MKVVITERMHRSGIDFLRKNGVDVELLYETNRLLDDAIKESDGVVVRLARITKHLLKVGSENRLKVVAKHGVGVDNIDIEAAKKLGVRVVYTPDVMTNAVAEFTLGSILLLAKKYVKYDSEVRRGKWEIRYYADNLEIKGKTLGLIGYGRIGKRVAKLARCFGMHVVVFDRYVKTDKHVKQVDLDALLRMSDFISVHVSLTKETYHMIGRRELEIVKEGVYIINSARGGIIDEKALCEAIEKGKVAGAVLDTTEQEPITLDNPILKCKNVILTAHTAGITDVAQVNESFLACKQVFQVLKGEEPPYALV